MKRIKIFNIPFGISLLATAFFASCTQRDDYPDFSNLQPDLPVEDIIPPDVQVTPLVQKIQSGSEFFKTFLIDSSETIVDGVEYTHVRFLNNIDQKVSMHILEIDRSQANIGIQALSPHNDYLYSTQVLPEMMLMNQRTAQGTIVAAIVGDAFSSGTPTGTYVRNGRVIKTNSSRTIPYVAVEKATNEIVFLNSPNATDFPEPIINPADYTHIIGGQNWMLFKGAEWVYTTTTTVARTSIGFTADMQKIYAITVDGVNDFSAGVSLNNLRTVYKAIGCSTAFYTNGSASSSLAVKKAGVDEWILKNFPQSGVAGGIANAIGFVVKN